MALSRVSRPWSRGRGRPCRTELQQSRVRSTWRDPQRRESASKVEIMDRCLKKAWRERQKALPRAKCEFGGAVCETDSRRGLLQSWRSVLCSPLFALRGHELAGSQAWGRCHDTGGHMRPSQDHQIPKGVPIMPRPERPKRARAILDRVEGRQNSVLPGCQAAQQPSSPARQV